MSNNHHNVTNWLLLLALTLIWGTSYILIKKGLVGFTAIELACLRISISFLLSVPLVIKAFGSIPREKFVTIFFVGLFGNGLPAFLFALSITHVSSSVTGILNALSPLWTLIIGYYFFRVAISSQKVTGVVIGFLGALLLVLGHSGGNFKVDAVYSFLPVLATLCYGISTNLMKQKLQSDNAIYTTSMSIFLVGVPIFAALWLTDARAKIIGGQALMPFIYIALLSIFGTFIAWMLFYRLVQRTDALFAASVTYLAPIVAIAWGLFDGEILSLVQVSGMALILAGVYFTTRAVKVKTA